MKCNTDGYISELDSDAFAFDLGSLDVYSFAFFAKVQVLKPEGNEFQSL